MRYIAYFLCFLTSFCAYTQTNQIDSYKHVVAHSIVDTIRCDAFVQLGVIYWDINEDSSIYFSENCLKLAKKNNDYLRIGTALKTIGVAYDIKGELDSCLQYLQNGKKYYEKVNRQDKVSNVLSDIASAWLFRGNYELALRNHLECLALRKSIHDEKLIAVSYNNIGLVYRYKKEYDKAIYYYQQSLHIKLKYNNEEGILNTYMNIGSAYQNKKKFDSAYYYGNLALILAKKLKKNNDVLACEGNIAAALINLNKSNIALPILLHVENEIINKSGDKSILVTVYESLGEIYQDQHRYAISNDYFKKGLNLSLSKNWIEAIELFHRKISQNYYQMKVYDLAYIHLLSAKKYNDSIFNIENNRQTNELTALYEMVEKEKAINKLYIDKKQQAKENIYLIITASLLFGILFITLVAFYDNRKKKFDLTQKNKLIKQSLLEKEFLMKEIHHRVKNNLQIVSSLLSLQSNFITDELVLESIKDSQNRVHSMSLIHQSLYTEENLSSINIEAYLSKLLLNLCDSYNTSEKNILISHNISPLFIDVDTVVPIGLIINEIITNAIKHAFIGKQNGIIKIKIFEENEILKIFVFDNGIGMPTNYESKNSFGLKLINAFLKKLNGTMKTIIEDGTKIELTLKYK